MESFLKCPSQPNHVITLLDVATVSPQRVFRSQLHILVSGMERGVMRIADDAGTASDADLDSTRCTAPSKQETAADFSEKIHWTDESDGVPAKPRKRKAKRKSSGKKAKGLVHGDCLIQDDEAELGILPDYLSSRRQDFEARKKKHHEAALMLPPDYSDVDFGELEDLGELQERPQFEPRSGIKPWRPYEDIELCQSAGLIPASIAQYLRDYQVDGVRFLHKKFVYQEGGILGDDMGLGKTVQVAAFLSVAFGKTGDERDDKRMRQVRLFGSRWYPRILIICPGSLIMNWKNELSRWGWWHIDIFHGANKEDVLGTARSGLLEIMITTYDTYKNARSSINLVAWDAVIADECHRLKDSYSETTKAVMEVNALCRIGLTGTAIQNKYEELWTLLDWTNPGHFGTRAEWSQIITRPLTVGQSHDATVAQLSLARQTAKKLVQNLLPRYFLRRMKTLIAHQLPRKTDRVVFCPLTDLQREAYENFLDSAAVSVLRTVSDDCAYHKQKKGWCCNEFLPCGTPWQNVVFPSMVVLQKLANHLTLLVPLTTDLDEKHRSELATLQTCMPGRWEALYEKRDRISNLVNPEFCGKWKILKKLLRFWHGQGDDDHRNCNNKVLVFSHSVRLLRILQHLLTSTSYNVSYLDGSLSYEARQEVVDGFNSDPAQFVFLISTKAGGVGLNITSANKVVIVDPHWNPAFDLQAQDRAYRIGQTRDVEVFRLISVGTIDEIIYARQVYKQQQANIGYTASSERRYFRGVQQDTQRRGEIFGLSNIFTYHSDMGLLRDIVNKTNIAEARAGVSLADVDMERVVKEEEEGDDGLLADAVVKSEVASAGEEGGGEMSQLADWLMQRGGLDGGKKKEVAGKAKSDAVQAILASAGVAYTHDNSEVVGSSRIEEQLSRRAEMVGDVHGQTTLFARGVGGERGKLHGTFRPPGEVCLRQFCEMGRELGFASATEFALVVEGWSREERGRCLDAFYRRRGAALGVQAASGDLRRSGGASGAIQGDDERQQGGDDGREEDEMGDDQEVKRGVVKMEDDQEVKIEREDEPKEKGIKVEDEQKKENIKVEDDEQVVKEEGIMREDEQTKEGIKKEDEKERFYVDSKSKRTSIFLPDSDDEDEL